jgi:hypothetical protein
VTWTRPQSIDGSLGSVTDTLHGSWSPKLKKPPLTGAVRVTVGAVLPTVIVAVAVALLPAELVTVSLAVCCPLVV